MRHFRPRLLLFPILVSGLLSLPALYQPSAARAQGATSPDERLILGLLEHNNSEGKKWHGVRVAFYKEGGQWKVYPTAFNTEQELSRAVKSFPAEVSWTVCSDGRTAGSLTSKNPETLQYYKDVGTHQISSGGSVPTVGEPSELFSGWPGGLTYRPLVLSSRGASRRGPRRRRASSGRAGGKSARRASR